MIIPAKNLPQYFHSLCFPAAIYEEHSNTVAQLATREQLLGLIARGHVVGKGTYNRIKRLELNEPYEKTKPPRTRGGFPIAEDNKTVTRQQLAGGVVFQHHWNRSEAYNRPLFAA